MRKDERGAHPRHPPTVEHGPTEADRDVVVLRTSDVVVVAANNAISGAEDLD